MPFTFRKSKKILPGARLSISKSGPSVSVGGRGVHYSRGRRGGRTSVSVPGTGISYRRKGCGCPLGILLVILPALLMALGALS